MFLINENTLVTLDVVERFFAVGTAVDIVTKQIQIVVLGEFQKCLDQRL